MIPGMSRIFVIVGAKLETGRWFSIGPWTRPIGLDIIGAYRFPSSAWNLLFHHIRHLLWWHDRRGVNDECMDAPWRHHNVSPWHHSKRTSCISWVCFLFDLSPSKICHLVTWAGAQPMKEGVTHIMSSLSGRGIVQMIKCNVSKDGIFHVLLHRRTVYKRIWMWKVCKMKYWIIQLQISKLDWISKCF